MPNRRFIPLIVVLSAMGVMGFSAVSPALPDLAKALGVDPAAIGWVQGAVSIPGAVLSVLFGWLADRYGRRPVLVAALVLFGLAGTAAAFVDTFGRLIALRMIQGAGGGALLGLPVVLIGDLFTGRERVKVMGWNLASITAAATTSPILGGALAEADPFRPFLIYATALMLVPVALRLPAESRRRPVSPLPHLRAAVREMRRLGTWPDFLSIQPAVVVTVLVFGGIVFTGTPLHLDEAFAVGPTMRGAMIALAPASAALTSANLQRLVTRFGQGRLFTGAAAAATVGLVLMSLPLGVWAAAVGLAAVGFTLGSVFPLLQVLVASAARDEYRGTVVGMYTTTVRASQAVSPVAASVLFATIGGFRMYALGALLTLMMVLGWRRVRTLTHRALTRTA